jgi:hypothetical protein
MMDYTIICIIRGNRKAGNEDRASHRKRIRTHGKSIIVQWIGELWNRAKKEAGIERDIQFQDLRVATRHDLPILRESN